jgi:hypothetical protein
VASSRKKLSVVAGLVVLFVVATVLASKSVQYAGGLMGLEIIKPRRVFFDGPPNLIWESGFQLDATIACNTTYERNVYVRFEKDLPFLLGSGERPEGRIQFQLTDDVNMRAMQVSNLRDRSQGGRRSSLSGEKIAWIKPVGFREYPAMGSGGAKCKKCS